MSELFEVVDLVRIAVEDERTGVAFYSAAAGAVRGADLKALLEDLARQEAVHQVRFEEILASMKVSPPREQYPGEYMEYLRTLTGQRAFPDEETAIRLAKGCSNDMAVVDLASWFERDTLMLMNELRQLVPHKDQAVVVDLIQEEQAHLVSLAKARRLAGA